MSSSEALIINEEPSVSHIKYNKILDIFQHLCLNLKNSKTECLCDNLFLMYCVPCKITLCQKCNYEEHKNYI